MRVGEQTSASDLGQSPGNPGPRGLKLRGFARMVPRLVGFPCVPPGPIRPGNSWEKPKKFYTFSSVAFPGLSGTESRPLGMPGTVPWPLPWPGKRDHAVTTRPAPTRPWAALALAALAVACLALGACGYKSWPKPGAKEDRFEWQSVDFSRKGNCLDVAGRLKGAAKNLDQVILQLQSEDSGCPGCPFTPDVFLEFGPGSQDFQMTGNDLRLTTCSLTSGRAYRFRLAGVNLFTSLGLSLSRVVTVAP